MARGQVLSASLPTQCEAFERMTSLDALLLGFDRARTNRGCAGADGVSLAAYADHLSEALARMKQELTTGTYRPRPLLRLLVGKKDGTARQLCVPAVRDRVAQGALFETLLPVFESGFESCSYAYRRGRGVASALAAVRRHYDDGYRWALCGDIDACFDSIDHDILMQHIDAMLATMPSDAAAPADAAASRTGERAVVCHRAMYNMAEACLPAVRCDRRIRTLIESWVRAEVWDGHGVSRLERGIPQGSVVSPALANLLLDSFDEALMKRNYRLVRYADDFLVLARDEVHARRAVADVADALRSLALTLDDQVVRSFQAGFTFLGHTFVGSLALPFAKAPSAKRLIERPRAMTAHELSAWGA